MDQGAPERLVANRYALQSLLRRGRSGVVWRATDLVTGGGVAVEEIEPPAEPEAERTERWSRIVQGARVAAAIGHPGAVALHDVLLDGDRLYVVTELVEALTLDELLERHGRLPPRRVAGIGLDVLEVLEAVHQAGLAHLDLQPASLLVTPDGATRVAGVGLAAVAPPSRPTPLPAPEQTLGELAGPPADLWALGAVMCLAVEGGPASALHEEPLRCEHAGPLAPVVEALLARTPSLRPPADEVRRQLQDAAGGTGSLSLVGAPPPAAAPRGHDATAVLSPVPLAAGAGGPGVHAGVAFGRAARARARQARLPGWRGTADWLLDPRRRGVLIAATSVLLALLSFAVIVAVIGNPTGSGSRRGQDQGAVAAPAPTTSATTSTTTTTTVPPTTAPPALPAGWTVFADERVGLRIAYPASWEVVRDGDHQAVFRDHSVPTFMRVEWRDGPAGDPVAAEQQSSQQHAALHQGSYQQVRIEPTQFQGRPAAVLEFTFAGDEQQPFRGLELGGDTPPGQSGTARWVAISMFAREADWGVAQAILQTALGSFVPPSA
jgi:eukaryotic-like serine/threonine-protein kinase